MWNKANDMGKTWRKSNIQAIPHKSKWNSKQHWLNVFHLWFIQNWIQVMLFRMLFTYSTKSNIINVVAYAFVCMRVLAPVNWANFDDDGDSSQYSSCKFRFFFRQLALHLNRKWIQFHQSEEKHLLKYWTYMSIEPVNKNRGVNVHTKRAWYTNQ